jgi:hypothetical protein
MKLKATLVFKDNKELRNFTNQWKRLPNAIAKFQQAELLEVVGAIKNTLEDDERPNRNKYPWKDHNYTGSLSDSVFASTTPATGKVVSKIGYGEEHGIYMEPAAEVQNNIFVPEGWGSDPKATLSGLGNSGNGIGPRTESFRNLRLWAYDILSRRTTDAKMSKKEAKAAATKWAKQLKSWIEKEGQRGYPIIIPHMELMFGEDGSSNSYLNRVADRIADILGVSEDKVPS